MRSWSFFGGYRVHASNGCPTLACFAPRDDSRDPLELHATGQVPAGGSGCGRPARRYGACRRRGAFRWAAPGAAHGTLDPGHPFGQGVYAGGQDAHVAAQRVQLPAAMVSSSGTSTASNRLRHRRAHAHGVGSGLGATGATAAGLPLAGGRQGPVSAPSIAPRASPGPRHRPARRPTSAR